MTMPKGSVIIEGDKLYFYLDRSLQSIGNASIHDAKQDIYGDRIDYDIQNDELHAINNVRIESVDSSIEGSELRLVLADNTGEMQSPTFTLNPQSMRQTPKSIF
jgi:LPS-assembly protein